MSVRGSQESGVRADVTAAAVAACDSLLLLLTSSDGGDGGGRQLRDPLCCAVSLARDDPTAALLLESLGGEPALWHSQRRRLVSGFTVIVPPFRRLTQQVLDHHFCP